MRFGLEPQALYRLACGHDAPAPAADPRNGDAEIHPARAPCPVCGVERLVQGYDADPEEDQ